jgi:hemerythrin-like domain-containing protein
MLNIRRRAGQDGPFVPDFDDPLGLLVRCHERIQSRLASLARAVDSMRSEGTHDVAEALDAVAAARAFFAGPGVIHTADEEGSLFPRLRRRAATCDEWLLAVLDELESQHRVAETVHAELDALVARLGERPAGDTLDALSGCAGALVTLYTPHIVLENETVFPAAARLLPREELLDVGKEMKARRRDLSPEHHANDRRAP